ncbi:MAG TPA: SurA N-terminal domain-containing protein [Burkholderiales bacterium]|nr:SurA N-terminal domain-containing protein [Burkholderiales bacterium]
MFDFVAKHKRLIQLVLALTMVPFAFFGLDYYTRASRGAANDPASVDGTPITQREFSDELRRQQDQLRQALGQNADPSVLDTPELRTLVLNSLITQRLLTNEVAKEHLYLSKDEVVAFLMAAPEFQEGGKFSRERYANYLRVMGLSDEGNVARLQLDIPSARLARTIAGTAMEPRTVADRLAAIQGEKREVAEAFVPAAPFAAGIKPEAAAMKAYYDSNPTQYRLPERVRAEYVVLSAEELARGETVSDAELKAAFDARASQFGVAEQRRASHILVRTQQEADQLLAEVRKAPQRFAELAKQRSQDSSSAGNGGDLGMNAKGSLASQALESEIFKLKPGEAAVVKSEFGFHVVRLDAIQPAKAGTLEEARKALTAELLKQKAAKKFAEAAEPFNNLVYEQADSLKPAAERYQLKIETTGWITRRGEGAPGPLAHPKLLAALFSTDSVKQKRNTDAIEVSPGVLVAARVAEYKPEALRPFDEVKAEVASALARREAAALAKKEGEAKLAALAKGGDAGLAWGAAKAVSREDAKGLSQAALRKIMAADAQKLPAYAGIERGEEGYVLYRISRVVPAEAPTPAQAAEMRSHYDQQAGAEQLDAYLLALRARAKVEIRPAALEKSAN